MINLELIIKKLNPISVLGDKKKQIQKVVQLDKLNFTNNAIAWINEKNIHQIANFTQGVIICPSSLNQEIINQNCTYLLFDNPRLAFKSLLTHFFIPELPEATISPSASIGKNVKLGLNVYIGNNTVIEDNVCIGDNVRINHNNSILSNTIIHNNVLIGSNNTIGGVGFGYEKTKDGSYEVIPHIGNVVIEEGVEIGNNTCIDRAVLGSTLLMQNCKIDNLVHIAHGVVIGKNSLIIAHAIIGGSTIIGDNVWVAPNASIINKINIGNNVTIGLGAVVVKNVLDNETVVGNPAKPIIKN